MYDFKWRNRKNPPISIYDTSGAYIVIQILHRHSCYLPRLREEWILERNDVEILPEIKSPIMDKRASYQKKLKSLKIRIFYNSTKKSQKAQRNSLYYAKQEIATPEWNILAIRETSESIPPNEQTKAMQPARVIVLEQIHQKSKITPEFVRSEALLAALLSQQHQSSRKRTDTVGRNSPENKCQYWQYAATSLLKKK